MPSHSTSGIEVIPASIEIEEEARLYDDILFDESPTMPRHPRPYSLQGAPSVFSNVIWLGDSIGESATFARGVEISGWTSVGDLQRGAYVVYDCVVKTKEGPSIHAHERYSDFVELEHDLLRTTSIHTSLRPDPPAKSPSGEIPLSIPRTPTPCP